MKCPHCGEEAEYSSIFCRFCGTVLSGNSESAILQKGPKFCTECGAKLPVGAKFCNKCGYKLKAVSEELVII